MYDKIHYNKKNNNKKKKKKGKKYIKDILAIDWDVLWKSTVSLSLSYPILHFVLHRRPFAFFFFFLSKLQNRLPWNTYAPFPPPGWVCKLYSMEQLLFFSPFICISWRLITLQYCSGFCHTLTWISHGFTHIPHPDPPSHLPLHTIPLGLPSTPGLSTCLVHPTWAGDLFHPR